MKHESITKDCQEMTALYALAALSQHEARAFDVHLRDGCPTCDRELKEFEGVADVLGLAVEPVAPPTYVRDLLAVRIQREHSEKPAAVASVIRFPEQTTTGHQTPKVVRSSLDRTLLPWAVAAALLVAFVYGVTSWQTARRALQAEMDHERDSSAAAANRYAELKEQLSKQSAQSAELAQINSVLGSPSSRIIQLTGQAPAPNSTATIYWDVQGNRWVVTADLSPPPEGKAYQLWFVTAQAKISAGLIRSDKSGHGFTALQVPADIGALAAAAITLEPEGGSAQPTLPIYLLGKPS